MSGRPRGRASRRSPGPSSSRNRTVAGLDRAKDTFNTKMDIDPDMLSAHKIQDSLLSSNNRFSDYRGIFNWCIIMLMLTNLHMFLDNYIEYGLVVDLGQVLYHFLKDPYSWPATYLILASNVFVVAALFFERWLEWDYITESTGKVLEIGNLAAMLLFPAAVILHESTSLSVGGSMLALIVYTVTALKIYSYHEVNSWFRQGIQTSSGTGVKNESEQEWVMYPNNLTTGNLYYFLLAPTLCYQLNFPRNVIIRKWFVARRALEIVLLSQLMIAMIQQLIFPLILKSSRLFTEMDMTAKIKHVMELVAPNNFIWIILFYWFCHSVLNFMAELLKFGDREFYADWWNSDNLNRFWTTLNLPFHKWSMRHVYRPLLMQGFPQWQAQVIVYMVSAALCEYVIAIPLEMFRFWIFATIVLQAKMTLLLGRFSSGNYGNCLVWLCMLMGPPIAVLTYLHDYYMLNRESNAWSLY
ncbi:diacylglycerol O-acyltransferase 1-like [Acipenser oxyrinchus oxyrinchus]|uniref:O-acyltransferase n=1 Tax=Acipenser oxyrinchus oxyrinchus TaxID=40147 RepID=A0AAD8D6I7_ACIOX|nr:diacylglycerol O-acyltransferase 1-like [Acipenser oxyrinchus oxyrinchus]